MPKKAVGTNPLYTFRGESKLTPENTGNQITKKVRSTSSNSTKVNAGKSDRGKGNLSK